MMIRNLLRLAVLVFALATTFGLTLPRPAEAQSCGTGGYFVRCSKKCCGTGVTTTYSRTGFGTSCLSARSACSTCLPACPSGQSLCGGPTFATCGF
jgi:hypothetical protein